MSRRLIAVVGILALALAYLPALVDALNAADVPLCCSGIMCPMHHPVGQNVVCDMGLEHPGATMQACPANASHYAATLAFVRVASPAWFSERVIDSAPVLAIPAMVNSDKEVASPPPRTVSVR